MIHNLIDANKVKWQRFITKEWIMEEKVSILLQLEVEHKFMEEARPILHALQNKTLQEQGLDYFYLVEDSEDPTKLFIIERWDSQEDFKNYINGASFKEFGQQGKYLITVKTITKLLPFFK